MVGGWRGLVDERGRPVQDPQSQEEAAEFIRARLAIQPAANQTKTPDQLVQELDWAKFGISKGPLLVKEADRARRAAGRALRHARAMAMQEATGKSADQREAEVFLATEEQQAAVDDAEVIYDFVVATARAADKDMSAVQTQARLVESTYRTAGTGRDL